MRRQRIDYSGFSLKKLRDPEYSHLLLLLGWAFYFAMYFVTERIPVERCHLIHCFLDDMIPFREEFVLVYVSWYLYVFAPLLYYLLYDRRCFRKLMSFIIVCQVTAVLIYILYPSIQDLRPVSFPRENVFTWLLGRIYAFDTPTGVMPSMHVAFSIGVASTVCTDKKAHPAAKAFFFVWAFAISASTMFVKQHSAVDVLTAIPLGLAADIISKIFSSEHT